MNLLEVKNICKTYGNGETAVKALKDVSFSVPKGEYVAIVGESGSGKSTLLNMIGALDTPTSGKVLIDGKDIFCMNDKKLTVFRRRNIGFINTICNSKIANLPNGFEGVFMIEESYYSVQGTTRSSSHLFLFMEENNSIKLISYEIPEGYDKKNFTYKIFKGADYDQLKCSAKFTPAFFRKSGDTWEGGSVSMFSPVLKFSLHEKFTENQLEVSESMEVNGKRTFGYDEPIIYKRIK